MNLAAIKPLPKLSPAEAQHQKLVTQTQKWVAQTFYGTVLQHMRNSPFKDKKFSGGRGGEAFGAMLDQRMADHMSRASGSKLVNAIVDKIESAQHERSGKPKSSWHKSSGIRPANPVLVNVRA